MSDCASLTFLIASSTSRLLAGTPTIAGLTMVAVAGWTWRGAPARGWAVSARARGTDTRSVNSMKAPREGEVSSPAMRTYFTCKGEGGLLHTLYTFQI